jgi:O-antigen/teichoic acid export membrane protein
MLKKFVRDIVAYLPSRLLPALTAFITTPIVTRLFAPAEYANYALALGVSELLVALASSGFGSAVVRFLPQYEMRAALGVFYTTLSVCLAALVSAVGLISFAGLALFRGQIDPTLYPLLIIGVITFVAQSGFNVFTSAARAQQRGVLYTVFQLLYRYGSLGLGLLLVLVFGFQVDGLLWGNLLALVLVLPPLVYFTTRLSGLRPANLRLDDAETIWRYAWPLALGNVAMWGLRVLDRFIISWYRPAREVGLYAASYGISERVLDIIVGLFLLSVSPMLMNTWERQGREATEKALTMVTRVYLIVCLPIAVGLMATAAPFVNLLTAPAYHEGARIVGYVALGSFAWGLSNIAQTGLAVGKRARRLGANQILAALVNLGLNILLVPRFGFVAAGLTTLIGYALLAALQAWSARVYLTWRFPFRTARNVVIAVGCMGLAAWGIYGLAGNTEGVNLGFLTLSVGAAVPIYLGCLWLLGEARQHERAAAARAWAVATERFGMRRRGGD